MGWPHLHAVGEHDAHGHEPGEHLEQLRVGEHAVLQAVVQEARVVAQHVIDVGRLCGERDPAFTLGTTSQADGLRGPGSGCSFARFWSVAIFQMTLCPLRDDTTPNTPALAHAHPRRARREASRVCGGLRFLPISLRPALLSPPTPDLLRSLLENPPEPPQRSDTPSRDSQTSGSSRGRARSAP